MGETWENRVGTRFVSTLYTATRVRALTTHPDTVVELNATNLDGLEEGRDLLKIVFGGGPRWGILSGGKIGCARGRRVRNIRDHGGVRSGCAEEGE